MAVVLARPGGIFGSVDPEPYYDADGSTLRMYDVAYAMQPDDTYRRALAVPWSVTAAMVRAWFPPVVLDAQPLRPVPYALAYALGTGVPLPPPIYWTPPPGKVRRWQFYLGDPGGSAPLVWAQLVDTGWQEVRA